MMSEQNTTRAPRPLHPELVRTLTNFLQTQPSHPQYGVKDDSSLYMSSENSKNHKRCIKEAPRVLGSLFYDIDEALRFGATADEENDPDMIIARSLSKLLGF